MVSFLLLPLKLSSDENNIPDQEVVVGQQKIIKVPYSYGDISISRPDIATCVIMREKREILIIGKVKGVTSIIIWDTRGKKRDEFDVIVLPEDLKRLMDSLKKTLGDIEGINFKIIGDKLIIDGQVYLEDDLRRINAIASKNELILNLVTLSPVTQRIISKTIEKEIDLPGVTVRPVRDKILLEGVVYSEILKTKAETIAKAYYENIVNLLEVKAKDRVPGKAKTIVIMAHFVELSKNLSDSWGFDWTPLAFSDRGIDSYFYSDYSGGKFSDVYGYAVAHITAFLPRLMWAKESGHARVLESPTISVKSGETAKIFSGLQVPFTFRDATTGIIMVEFKDVGVTLEVTPYDQGDSVDLEIELEVSEMGEIGATGEQAIDTSRFKTVQFCKAGESIVIGGLHRVSDSVTYNKEPDRVEGMLFQLYKNKEYQKKKTQFLVFITPQIHETSSTANREIQEKFNLKEIRP